MKRMGNLYAQICTPDALLAAYRRASERKRSHRACFEFARNLGTNLQQLQRELQSGTYRPLSCNRFWVKDGPKPRLIEAPAFRDLVVQHAAYAVLAPIFERRYIATSFACRTGKGTHSAADWLQAAIRRAPRTSWVLHVDVRKFFYSIDRSVLQGLLARTIKCPEMLDLLAQFAHRDEPTGVPIGNLMSQTFANVYLNSLDQFCKRTLKVRDYGRYMDDSIMLAPDLATARHWLDRIRQHLALLGMEISHYALQPVRRGANFVGFRTWASGRFIRPHVIGALRTDARRGRLQGVISRLGHARRTCSFQPLMTHLETHHHDLYLQLPQSFHAIHHHPDGAARFAGRQ
ncbi:MAG TPA: reverse transcriptase/maturase family protein [Acidovorax sp.]